MIANHSYKVGGVNLSYVDTPKEYYDAEVGIGQTGYAESMKIGLMYACDFLFAVNNSYWTESSNAYGDNTSLGSNNWMYMGLNEWTISNIDWSTRAIGDFGNAVFVSSYGPRSGLPNNQYVVRPVFYLNSDVVLTGGSGTESDPYRISI